MAESPSATKSIKQLIRSGGFSKRLNLGRPRIPTPSLSTINSAGSEEEDGNDTDIDDGLEDKRISEADKESAGVITTEIGQDSSPAKPTEQSFAQRAIFAGMPTLIQNIGSRRSNISAGSNRSSRTSIASSRSSQITVAAGLPTIKEGPGSPGFIPDDASTLRASDPSATHGQDDSIIPVIEPPLGFQPMHGRSISDAGSIASTLAPTPPRNQSPIGRKSMTPPLPQYVSKGPTPPHSYRLPSDFGSEKSSGKHSSYSPSTASSHTFNSTGPSPPAYSGPFEDDKLPGSRFSWHRSNQDKAKDWWTKWFVEWWGIELISIGLSAICMIIIMSVLAGYNGKELPAWKVGITINAFISIFAGFAKAALLLPTAEALGQLKWNWFSKKPRQMMDFEILDSASRGPWGSFVLLARTKGITLASVGAAIILLSLPLDLFFQQIVQYPTVWTATGKASISRTVVYDPTPDKYRDASQLNGSDSSYNLAPDPTLFNEAFSMFYSDVVATPPSAKCNAQRCTWEPYDTLALCSACAPIPAASMEFGCQKTPDDWMVEVPWQAPEQGGNNGTVDSCGWYFKPSEGLPILMSGYAMNATGRPTELLAGRLLQLREPYSRLPIVDGATIMFPDIKAALLNVLISQSPDVMSGVLRNSTPRVEECVVNWCVQTVKSGLGGEYGLQVSENVTEVRQLDLDHEGDPWIDPDWFAPNYNLTLPDKFAEDGNTSTYTVNNETSRNIVAVFNLLAPSTFTAYNETAPINFKYNFRFNFFRDLNGGANPWLFPSDTAAHFNKMVRQMSLAMRRQQQADKLSLVPGTEWNTRVHVRIRWAWIILPSILFVFSLLFLTLTMIKSQKDGSKIGIWKTSQLAVLFNGLGEEVQSVAPSNPRLGNVRQTAKNTLVSLED